MSVKHLNRFYTNKYEKNNEGVIRRRYIKYNNFCKITFDLL